MYIVFAICMKPAKFALNLYFRWDSPAPNSLIEYFLHFQYFAMHHIQIWAIRKIDMIVSGKFRYGYGITTQSIGQQWNILDCWRKKFFLCFRFNNIFSFEFDGNKKLNLQLKVLANRLCRAWYEHLYAHFVSCMVAALVYHKLSYSFQDYRNDNVGISLKKSDGEMRKKISSIFKSRNYAQLMIVTYEQRKFARNVLVGDRKHRLECDWWWYGRVHQNKAPTDQT